MNATLVTAASRFEGESDADTANTTNAAAALNQMLSWISGSYRQENDLSGRAHGEIRAMQCCGCSVNPCASTQALELTAMT
eukprot:scaffold134477_cov44-Tisochrysis_lutea.AAC.1